jgi:hypothetical protein
VKEEIMSYKTKTRPELLAACMKLQCKTLNGPGVEAIVIKTASMMISLAGDIARYKH